MGCSIFDTTQRQSKNPRKATKNLFFTFAFSKQSADSFRTGRTKMAHQGDKHALDALADYDDDFVDDAATEDEDDAPTSPTSPTSAAPVAAPRLMITNGPEQAAAPTATAALRTNQAVWLPLVVTGPDGKPLEVRVKAILGKIYNKGGDPDSTECTVVIKGVNYNSLTKRGKSRPRRAPRAHAQPESSAQGAAASAARERNEVPLEDQRPPKKQKPEPEPPTRAVVRILVVEHAETVPQLLENLKPLARADLFVAGARGAMELKHPALPQGSFTEVAFVTRTVKKQTKVDLRAIHALVATIRGVAQKDLLAAIAFDSDTVSDEDLLWWPNLALLDTETVAEHGIPTQLPALVASPEYVKLAGPVRAPPTPPKVVEPAATPPKIVGPAATPPTVDLRDDKPEVVEISDDEDSE